MENFEVLDQNAGTVEKDTAKTAAKKAEKQKENQEMKALLKQRIENDPTYLQVRNTLSDSLVVTNSLGFSDKGGIAPDPTGGNSRPQIPLGVGYIVENIGANAIPYRVEVYSQDENGVWVPNLVDRELAPGQKVALPKKWLTALCAIPEISFQLKNGNLVRSSANAKKTLEAELARYYFRPSDPDFKINSDENQINISEKINVDGTEKWIVKPEYCEIFGYLNNEPTKKNRGKSKSDHADNKFHAYSNYVFQMMNEAGM